MLAHGRLVVDPLDHQRLRVRGLVLLVVPEAAVADDVDHEVVPELGAVRERERDRAQSSLRVVGVDVHDRDVEALGEIARVARRAALRRVGREGDLVVRDQVERAPGGVALEALEVERLGHDPLPRKGRVAVDQDRQRDGGVVQARPLRAVGLLGAGPPLDDRVDGLEVARVRRDRHLDLTGGGDTGAGGGKVVLDVAAAALRVDDQRVVGALTLELPQDRLVRASDRVDERVEATPVGHPDHDLVRAALRTELDRLVEHRDEHVEPLERELLLAEERAAQVLLDALDLGQTTQEAHAALRLERDVEAAGLDRLAQPDALGVVRDVLDLVGARPHVHLAQPRQRLEQRVAGDVEAQHAGRDPRLELGRQRGDEPRLVEGRVTQRLRAERVEPRGEVPVHAVRLDECHRGGDGAEEARVLGRHGRRRDGCRRGLDWRWCPVARLAPVVGDHRRPGLGLFEDPAPLGWDARGGVAVVLEQLRHVGRVGPRHLGRCHLDVL